MSKSHMPHRRSRGVKPKTTARIIEAYLEPTWPGALQHPNRIKGQVRTNPKLGRAA